MGKGKCKESEADIIIAMNSYPIISSVLAEFYLLNCGYRYADLKDMDPDDVQAKYMVLSQLFSDNPIRDKTQPQMNMMLPFPPGGPNG